MKDKIFIDTNIFVYAYLSNPSKKDDLKKHLQAQKLLRSFEIDDIVLISTQVCNEYYSALLKNKISDDNIQDSLSSLIDAINVVSISKDTVLKTFEIKNRYDFSYWDSLILSSALENGCTLLYSEDMQHNQVLENRLKIINPFISE